MILLKKSGNFFDRILIGAIFLVIGAVFFYSRQIFYFKYEPEYYEDLYYHSQWNYPGSNRGISDGELYKFVGYRLIEGENPFNINFEAPPLGKSLYGLAEKFSGNPFWVSVFLYLASVGIVFLFTKDLLGKTRLALFACLLFVTTPLVATQVRETMLDLPLMFLFLVHAWSFNRYLSKKGLKYLLIAGIFLGLATGTKFGVYTPLIGILGWIFILFVGKKFSYLIAYPFFVITGYVLAYFTYFLRHPNPIPWLRLHEKVLRFYIGPPGKIDYLNQWRGIFLNTYQGWWQAGRQRFGDWSLVLPVGTIILLAVLFLALKKKDKNWIYLALLVSIFLLVNSLVPFWSRYLIPAVPFFVLLIVFFLQKRTSLIILLILSNLPFWAKSVVPGNPLGDAQAVATFTTTRAYRELYRSITVEDRDKISETDFVKANEKFFQDLGVRKVEMEIKSMTKKDKEFNFPYRLKYLTRYGELIYESTLTYLNYQNQWRLAWNWDFLWPGYSPEEELRIEEGVIPLLKVVDSNGRAIAQRGIGKELYKITRVMFRWNEDLGALAEVIGESNDQIDQKIRWFIPDHFPRFLGYLDPILDQEGIQKASQIPGVTFKDTSYLVIPQNFKDKEYAARAIKELTQKRPDLFFVQAQVYFENNQGEKIFLPFKRSEEKDLILHF